MKDKKKKTFLPGHLVTNRKLIWNLAKNDFRKKFAGSYFGVIWAFVTPVITVLLYWFVFQAGLHSEVHDLRTGIKFPFVLWLMAGLVPWFYFQEAMNGGANVLVEYSYLVKKVVFQIDMLPVVKLVSALFTHAFFVCFVILIYWLMGYPPDFYVLQVVYYSFCMILFTTGLVYALGAVTVFFRDMKEVVGIVLQIGMWITPIMWDMESMAVIPGWALKILRLNPMYYIVSGYRDALIHKIGFWEHPGQTAFFWAITLVILFVGSAVFKRLRPHFADVL